MFDWLLCHPFGVKIPCFKSQQGNTIFVFFCANDKVANSYLIFIVLLNLPCHNQIHTSPPLHPFTTSPLRHFTLSPLRHFTLSPLRPFTTSPLHPFTTSPLRHFTLSPLLIHHPQFILFAKRTNFTINR